MPITITLDDVSTSSIDQLGNAGVSAVRGGWADDLPSDTLAMQPEDVLFAVRQAVYDLVPQGSTYPGTTNSFFNRVQVSGLTSGRARVKLIYEPFQGTGTSLIIDSSSTLATYATNLMPGTLELLRVYFDGAGGQPAIPDDYPIINMLRPMRRRAVTQLRAGTYTEDQADAFEENVGLVNNATWRNKKKGSWIVSGAQASVSRYSGFYQTRLEALCQGEDTWSYYAIAKSNLTGKYAGTADGIQAQIGILKGKPYGPQVARNGVSRFDPYLMTNFTSLFGF